MRSGAILEGTCWSQVITWAGDTPPHSPSAPSRYYSKTLLSTKSSQSPSAPSRKSKTLPDYNWVTLPIFSIKKKGFTVSQVLTHTPSAPSRKKSSLFTKTIHCGALCHLDIKSYFRWSQPFLSSTIKAAGSYALDPHDANAGFYASDG